MTTCILAGDVGGTKTDLAVYVVDGEDVSLVRQASFPSTDYSGLEDVIGAFREASSQGRADESERWAAAAFGIAGPVLDGKVTATNLPWQVDEAGLSRTIGGGRVRLLNDLEATAYGTLFLPDDAFHVLQAGTPRTTHRAVIAAGTGLGQAILFWDGRRYVPSATEGGHADFAPRDDRTLDLWRFLRPRFDGRVSIERVVSGPGLIGIFEFVDQVMKQPVTESTRLRMQTEDPAAVIGEAALAGTCPACVEAVDIFVSLYGAQAGNLALTVMSLGGVYIGGGIVTKLLPKMADGGFLRAFVDKGRFADLLRDIPVRIVLDPKAAQLGAAHVTREIVGTSFS